MEKSLSATLKKQSALHRESRKRLQVARDRLANFAAKRSLSFRDPPDAGKLGMSSLQVRDELEPSYIK